MRIRIAAAICALAMAAGSALAHEGGPRHASKRLAGYFIEWGIYGRNYLVKDVKDSGSAEKLTHILYAFANVTPDLKCGIADSWADYSKRFDATESVDGTADAWWPPQLAGNFNQLQKLKVQYPNIKLMISVGGWTFSDKFSDAALTPESRQAFVSSCVDMFINGNFGSEVGPVPGLFDGIDIDWEYPGACGNTCSFRPEDTQNFTALMAEFRKQLDAAGAASGKHYELSAATSANLTTAGKIELPKVAKSLDFFNVMTYDFHGSWEPTTNFLAPLLRSFKDPDPANRNLNVNDVVTYYLRQGVPARKLDVGVPFYGRGWAGVPDVKHGLYQPTTGAAPGVWEAGSNDYKALAPLTAAGYTAHRDPLSLGFWIYSPTDGVFWSYDDPLSAHIKGEYVRALGLGGAFFWELSGDDAQGTLISSLRDGLD